VRRGDAGVRISHVGDSVSAKAPKRLGVVIGEFHDQLMNACLEDVRLAAVSMGADIKQVRTHPRSE
jgi:6,7-dimethyl-8-ribityllumazine synthase